MIKVYSATENSFNHNGLKILKPLSAQVFKQDNGDFYLDLETSIDDIEWMVQDNIVMVNTPWGEQGFRLGNPEIKKNVISVRAKHLYFDTANYVINYVKVENTTAIDALNQVIAGTDQKCPFTVSSDIEDLHSIEIKHKSLEEAIAIISEMWNGHLDRDNFSISLKQNIGVDRGVTIAYGKNLTDFKAAENWDNVVTKLLPLGNNDVMLPEVYLSADVQYDIPYTRTITFSPSDGVNAEDENAVIEDLRKQALIYLNKNKYPKVNYTVNAHIENVVDIGDTIGVIHKKAQANLLTNVISVKYDCILGKFKTIEFGNFRNNLKSLIKSLSSQIDSVKEDNEKKYSALDSALLDAKNTIMHYLTKGHKYITENAIYFLDTSDPATAKKFMIISLGGIGFGSNGIDNGYVTAWTLDGKFVADFITAGTLSSILLKSTNYIENTSGMKINLENGCIDTKNFKLNSYGNIIANDSEFNGKITSYEGNIGGWQISNDGLTSKNTVASIDLYNQDNHAMQLSYKGLHLFNHYSGNNEYIGSLISSYSPNDGTNGLCLVQPASAEYLALGYTNATTPSLENNITVGMYYTQTGSYIQGGYYKPGFTFLGNIYTNGYDIDAGDIVCNSINIDGGSPLTNKNYTSFPVAGHVQSSTTVQLQFNSDYTATFYYGAPVATPSYCHANFQPLSSSDMRLKKNIRNLDELPDELYFSLKVKLFEFKCTPYKLNVSNIGLLAQEVISAFKNYSLDAFQYGIVEYADVRSYTDEGMYVTDGKVLRVNYEQLIAWGIQINQKQQKVIDSQADKINELELRISKLEAA